MSTPRYRPVFQAAVAIAVIWVVAVAGYKFALRFVATVDEVNAYATSVDMGRVTGAARNVAMHKLEGLINGLSEDDLTQVSVKAMSRWRDAMTDAELEQFRSATTDSGYKLPSELDELPPEQREKALAERLEKLRVARAQAFSDAGGVTNGGSK